MRWLFLNIALLVGCGGGDGPNNVDASTVACTNAIYDPCTTNDMCTSAMCHVFNGSTFTVCTMACTPGNNDTCPLDKSGAHASCNNMGICKPVAPNDCTR